MSNFYNTGQQHKTEHQITLANDKLYSISKNEWIPARLKELHVRYSPPWVLSALAILEKNLKVRQTPVSLSHSPPALQLQVWRHSTPYVPYTQSEERRGEKEMLNHTYVSWCCYCSDFFLILTKLSQEHSCHVLVNRRRASVRWHFCKRPVRLSQMTKWSYDWNIWRHFCDTPYALQYFSLPTNKQQNSKAAFKNLHQMSFRRLSFSVYDKEVI